MYIDKSNTARINAWINIKKLENHFDLFYKTFRIHFNLCKLIENVDFCWQDATFKSVPARKPQPQRFVSAACSSRISEKMGIIEGDISFKFEIILDLISEWIS